MHEPTTRPAEASAEQDEGRGRTRWTLFAAILGLGGVGAALLMIGLATGSLAASFTVSGSAFKVSADSLSGKGFVQYGGIDRARDGAHPVVVNGFRSASLDNFCQSVVMPGLPALGDVSLKMTAGGNGGMSAENLVVDVSDLDADLTLSNPQIGVDASKLTKGPAGANGLEGTFGLQADEVKLARLRQTAWSTTAATLRFKGLHLSLTNGRNECF